MTSRSFGWLTLLSALAVALFAVPASAFPGFYVGKKVDKRVSHASFVVVMNHGETSVVSVMPDYDGPFEPFGLVLAVPGDVTIDRVTTLRREFLDRVDQISAPRFHEFWETDPCDPGPVQQEWERDLRVKTGSDNFLGSGVDLGPIKKVPKELLMNVKSEQKAGEYTFFMAGDDESFVDLVKSRGWVLTDRMQQAVKRYVDAGMKFVLAEVDPNRIELIGGERAQLSPVRFWTDHPYRTIPSTLGRLASDGFQELFVLVLDPEKRFQTTNYAYGYPPTNIKVEFVVKERMGEFFGALHDLWLARHPQTFWEEYAWSSDGCGQPCPNEPLLINELLTLGGDVFEQNVPDEEKNPKPPEMTEEEKRNAHIELEGFPPAERAKHKKLMQEDRKELFRRRALLDRNHYVITRLHHRYDDKGLPKDVEIGPAEGGITGGVGIPKGKEGVLPLGVKPTSEDRFQTRFLFFHPWKGMQACEKPMRWRWGKPPRTYRGLRKTWVVEDLVRKSRTQIKPADVVRTPIPSLGLTGEPPKPVPVPGADAGAQAGKTGGRCGCRTPGGRSNADGLGACLILLGLFSAAGRRRRERLRSN